MAGSRADGNKLNMIVWPETSVPDYLLESEEATAFVQNLLKGGVPLLAGSMDAAGTNDHWRFYNSAILLDASGRAVQRYDKVHLVPFGEYIPLAGALPFLQRLAPMGWTCTPGTVNTVFRLPGAEGRFSALICFEDAFPELARADVRDGARLLVNLTNDAWFDRSAGALQHLSHCIFRCVENRVSAVRAANSGLTCFIDRNGELYHQEFRNGETLARRGPIPPLEEAWTASGVYVAAPNMPLTLYTRRGDLVLAIPAAFVSALCLLLAFLPRTSVNRPG